MFHVLCLALCVMKENDTLPALKGLTVFGVSRIVSLPRKEGWSMHSATENSVILLSCDSEHQYLCTICAQKNQLRESLLVRR